MKKQWVFYIGMILLALFIAGCSNEKDENEANGEPTGATNNEEATGTGDDNETGESSETDSGEKLYYEVGETFEFIGYYPSLPIEITVNKIWMEDGADHQAYIDETGGSADENATVTFIDYTVTNKGDETLPFNDVLPRYAGADAPFDEIDLSYPENDLVKDYFDGFKLELEPGETMDVVGAVSTTTYSENGGAFVWSFMEDIPKVVFQTPQSERNDKMGVYDIGEEIYVVDQTEDHQLIVTIDNISETDDVAEFEDMIENSAYIVIDMTIENAGKENQNATLAFPDPVIDGEGEWHANKFKRDGVIVEDPWNDNERIIEPGETINGQVFIEVGKDVIDDVQLYYFDSNFLSYPEYSKIINYHLD